MDDRKYLEAMLRESDKRYEQRFQAQEKAIDLASLRANLISIASLAAAIVAIVVSIIHK